MMSSTLKFGIAVALVLTTMAGCSDSLLGTGSAGGVEARVYKDGVTIANGTPDSIGYVVFDADVFARVGWLPCVAPECPWIQPKESAKVLAQDVWEWRGSEALLVFWWHAVPFKDGTLAADSVRVIRIEY